MPAVVKARGPDVGSVVFGELFSFEVLGKGRYLGVVFYVV